MPLSHDQVRAMAAAVDLTIPQADLPTVTSRLNGLLTSMQEIERDLGAAMDEVEPVPPMFDMDSE